MELDTKYTCPHRSPAGATSPDREEDADPRRGADAAPAQPPQDALEAVHGVPAGSRPARNIDSGKKGGGGPPPRAWGGGFLGHWLARVRAVEYPQAPPGPGPKPPPWRCRPWCPNP